MDSPTPIASLTPNQITPCVRCKGPLVSPDKGVIHFYRVTIETYVPDRLALMERAGLQMIWGNAPGSAKLAEVFSTQPHVAHAFATRTVNLCFECASLREPILIYSLESEEEEVRP